MNDIPEFLRDEPTDMMITECAHFSVAELEEKVKSLKVAKTAVIHVMPPEKYRELERTKMLLPKDGDEYII